MQPARSLANAYATHPEHVGNRLLQHHKLARAGIVAHGEQPARHPLLDVVVLAAGHRLADHRNEAPGVVQKQSLNRAAETQLLAQVFRLHPHRAAWQLHDRPVGRDDAAQEDVNAHDPFAADDADLDRTFVVRGVDHGHHSVLGKVHRVDLLIRPIHRLTALPCHVLELGQQAPVLGGKERRQDAVPDRSRRGTRAGLVSCRRARQAFRLPRDRPALRRACP